MRKMLFAMPGTFIIMFTWVIIWLLVITKNVMPILEGKGISKIGNEYYRFFTAPLTHFNFIHLLFNVVVMFWIGYLYEERLGTIRFLFVAVLCAVLAQIIFLCIYRDVESSIGGSLYNYALIGFGLTLQFLIPGFPKVTLGTQSGDWIIIGGILGNFPILPFMNITTFIGHAIAFAVGVVVALICWMLGLR